MSASSLTHPPFCAILPPSLSTHDSLSPAPPCPTQPVSQNVSKWIHCSCSRSTKSSHRPVISSIDANGETQQQQHCHYYNRSSPLLGHIYLHTRREKSAEWASEREGEMDETKKFKALVQCVNDDENEETTTTTKTMNWINKLRRKKEQQAKNYADYFKRQKKSRAWI